MSLFSRKSDFECLIDQRIKEENQKNKEKYNPYGMVIMLTVLLSILYLVGYIYLAETIMPHLKYYQPLGIFGGVLCCVVAYYITHGLIKINIVEKY